MTRPSTMIPMLLMAALISGCASRSVYRASDFNPTAVRRVAVLPFIASYEERGAVSKAVDKAPLIGGRAVRGERFFRRAMIAGLRRGPYDVVEPAYIDTLMDHSGILRDDGFRDISSQDIGRLLAVDAIVIGEVLHWDIDYYGVETRQRVECRAQLIDARTGKTLVESTVREAGGRGLSGGPTGYLAAAFEPIRGLAGKELLALGRQVDDQLIEPFLPSRQDLRDAERHSPFLLFVTHDRPSGRPLRPGDVLTVMAQGAPGMTATWQLGTTGLVSSMVEIEPGVYIGKFLVPAGLRLESETVSARLENAEGYSSVQQVLHKPLSGEG